MAGKKSGKKADKTIGEEAVAAWKPRPMTLEACFRVDLTAEDALDLLYYATELGIKTRHANPDQAVRDVLLELLKVRGTSAVATATYRWGGARAR